MTDRVDVVAALATAVLGVRVPHPVRVAVDGCSAAGKTTLAAELATHLRTRTERTVIEVGIDHFKRAVDLRTAFPPDSPESYYLDSWDNDAIRRELLDPLGPGGDRDYRTEIMDFAGRVPSDVDALTAPDDAILIADGCFLQRPELDDGWDLRIFLDVSFDEVLRRGTERDRAWMGSAAEARARYLSRYIPGERRYLDEVGPRERAQIVVDNGDPKFPVVIRGLG